MSAKLKPIGKFPKTRFIFKPLVTFPYSHKLNKVIFSSEIETTPNSHRHKCSSCETVWQHNNKAWERISENQLHKCPKCGVISSEKYKQS